MVKRFIISVALLIPVAIIAQIDWSKQIKNFPPNIQNALQDPGASGIVKRTTANTSTVAGGSDVWPGTLPYSSLTAVPTFVGGPGTTISGYIPTWNSTNGTLLQAGINPAGAWPGTLPYASLTSVPNHLLDSGANGVVYRNALNTTAPATGSNLPQMVASGVNHSAGAVPDPGAVAGTTRYLREDGTWQTAGGGISTQSGNLGPQNGGNATRSLGGIQGPNNTGKPIVVSVTAFMAATNSTLIAKSDATVNNPTQVVNECGNASVNTWCAISFWVMPNNYWVVTSTGTAPTIEYWTEWN